MRTPTDLEILTEIYERYYDEFVSTESKRSARAYVPIDIVLIAHQLRVDPDIVLVRLYYHLQRKHGIPEAPFFTLKAGTDRHCVHFPNLGSVLADLQLQHRNFWMSTFTAFLSLGVSVAALLVALLFR